MPTYRCHDLRFDSERLALTRDGQTCPLRPKAAALLAFLIAHRDRIVAKSEIARAVWHTRFVSDQTLFQTMCELRKALAPHAPITTHPNLGYRWSAPLIVVRPKRRAAIAAGVALATTAAALLALAIRGPGPGEREVATLRLSPAMEAFATGLGHLRADDAGEAGRYFELALRENPAFVEARLMLSEALLAQGRLAAARGHATALVDGVDPDAYASVAAMEVLSRADGVAGDADSALGWVLAAADRAREEGFACTVANLEERVVAMMTPLSEHVPAAVRVENLTAAADDSQPAPSREQPDYCRQIQPLEPGARRLPPVVAGQPAAAHCRHRRSADSALV